MIQLHKNIQKLFDFLEQVSSKKFATLIIVASTVMLSLVVAFPSYDQAWSLEMKANWDAVIAQAGSPFTVTEYGAESHAANLTFRLTPVLLATLIGINSIGGFLMLQFVAFVFLIFVIYRLFKSIISDPVVVCLLMTSIATVFVGNVLCSDYRGIFDVIAYLFLGCAMLSSSWFLIIVFSFLAFFTDERALIASGMIYVYFLVLDKPEVVQYDVADLFPKSRRCFALITAWIIYFLVRFYLSYQFQLETNSAGIIDYVKSDPGLMSAFPFGVWTGLEGFWIIVILAAVMLLKSAKPLLLLYLLSMIVVILVALSVFDITRSMAYLFPSVFVASIIISRNVNKSTMRYIVMAVSVVCLFFPTYYLGGYNIISWLYPLPVQILRLLVS